MDDALTNQTSNLTPYDPDGSNQPVGGVSDPQDLIEPIADLNSPSDPQQTPFPLKPSMSGEGFMGAPSEDVSLQESPSIEEVATSPETLVAPESGEIVKSVPQPEPAKKEDGPAITQVPSIPNIAVVDKRTGKLDAVTTIDPNSDELHRKAATLERSVIERIDQIHSS